MYTTAKPNQDFLFTSCFKRKTKKKREQLRAALQDELRAALQDELRVALQDALLSALMDELREKLRATSRASDGNGQGYP